MNNEIVEDIKQDVLDDVVAEGLVKIKLVSEPEVIYEETVKEAVVSVNGKLVTIQKRHSFRDGCDLEDDEDYVGRDELTEEEDEEFHEFEQDINWRGE